MKIMKRQKYYGESIVRKKPSILCLILWLFLVLFTFSGCLPSGLSASNSTAWYEARVGQRLADFDSYGYSREYNTSNKGQCVWYVRGRAYEKLGVNTGLNGNGNQWYERAIAAGLSTGYEVRSNSIACFNGGTYGHVIFVEWVDGDTVYYTEANKSGDNAISDDDGQLTKSTVAKLRSRLSGSYQGCIYLNGGSQEWDIDARYPTPFYAYIRATDKVECYGSVNGAKVGYIYVDDECLIQEIYTNGWCKLVCPWPSEPSGKKTVYIYTDAFVPYGYYLSEHNILSSAAGYRKSNMANYYATIPGGAHFWRVGKENGRTQIIYHTEGVGYRCMWITHTGDKIDGINVGSDFYAYIINTAQWRHVTNDSNNVSVRTMIPAERQIWKFEYRGNGYYNIVSCSDGQLLDVVAASTERGANIQTWERNGNDAQLWMLCGRWNGEVTLEPKCTNMVMDIAGASTDEGANIQTWEYNGSEAQKFQLWTDLSYSVWYNANGGSNPPAAQNGKQYLSTFPLSTQKPSAPTYKITYDANGGSVSSTGKTVSPTFKNWNTKQDGSGAAYNPGASFTIHEPTTMYAQWNAVQAGTLTTPTRKDYTFDGWYTSKSGGTKVTSSTVVTGDMTLYAHWTNPCANGHSYTYTVTKNPTVSTTGSLTGTCSKCSSTATVTLPKLNTTDYTYTVTKAATCTSDGTGRYTWKTTTYGNFHFDVPITKTGHSFGNWSVTKQPTCTEKGQEKRTCSSCGHAETRDVAAKGHTWESATCTKPKTCKTCGATDGSAKGHSFGNWSVTKQPTCTEKGQEKRTCSSCGHAETRDVAAKGHTWESATCTKPKTCKTCGATDGSAKGHSFGNWSVTKQPTCTEKGQEKRTCSSCGHAETRDVAAKGHTWESATCTKPKTCKTCGVTDGSAKGHSFGNWSVTKQPTC
ncbi:MAG: CHAP domain-containing protein, partial [Ruminococcaceae bacterium]|nr:CHAP domain-containing protein [Oscillospiraceae bacterium]